MNRVVTPNVPSGSRQGAHSGRTGRFARSARQLVGSQDVADAMLEAAARDDKLLEEGYPVAAAVWHRIIDAIERLQAEKPAEGEKVH